MSITLAVVAIQLDAPQRAISYAVSLLLDPYTEDVFALPNGKDTSDNAVRLFELITDKSEEERLEEDRRDGVEEAQCEFSPAVGSA